jgi:hypothetical protein
VTFKDLRKIIAENQKFDDDKIAMMRLRLWPAESGNGNGNGHNNSRPWEWKGRPIISSEEWKRLAGYKDFYDVLTSEEREYLKINMDLPDEEIWNKAESRVIREINPKALDYFPADVITVVFNPYYTCPKSPEIYKLWVSDYRELLTAKGYRTHEYDGSWWEEKWERLNTDWRARVGASEK